MVRAQIVLLYLIAGLLFDQSTSNVCGRLPEPRPPHAVTAAMVIWPVAALLLLTMECKTLEASRVRP